MKALLLVDIQNDFLPGGALPVSQGDKIIPVVNKLLGLKWDLIVASKDWHPSNHGSFALNHGKNPGEKIVLDGLEQILWPVHCVQGSLGVEFPVSLASGKFDQIVFKGGDPKVDSYSAFFDNGKRKATGLVDILKHKKIDTIYVVGLATDYCVKFTVLDALQQKFDTYLIIDACRGVDLNPGDSARAIEEIRQAGARTIKSEEVESRE